MGKTSSKCDERRMSKMAIRTDLALEARTLWQESVGKTSELAGVKAREFQLQGLDVTEVQILDEQGAEALQKPVGRYLTLEIENDHRREEAKLNQASEALAQTLGSLLRLERTDQVLVVGLGNPAVTPDALGPKTLNYVLVTRHLIEQMPEQFSMFRPVSALAPGVLGTTGLESVEVVRGVIEHAAPTHVIVIDALASRDPARVCSTIQLADTGIVPGSGIGNSREAFNRQSLGVPVIAVGVPTVVDAATLVTDYLERNGLQAPEDSLRRGLVVTPSDIDAKIGRMARILGLGISRALHPELTIAEIQNCLG